MNIAGLKIGPDQPCRIVSEIGTSHNGSKALALRLIREAAEAGADLVKFQCYLPDEMVALRGDGPAPPPWDSYGTLRQLYERAQTPHVWFPELVSECERLGVPWFSSVFGFKSLVLLESLGCPAYKIASLDARSAMQGAAAMTGKPIINSRSSIPHQRDGADLCLLCPPEYPQERPEDIYWAMLRWKGKITSPGRTSTNWRDGFSYHGTDVATPIKAIEMGALMVEVHVQLDDIPSELDAHSSLTVSQLQKLCEAVRR